MRIVYNINMKKLTRLFLIFLFVVPLFVGAMFLIPSLVPTTLNGGGGNSLNEQEQSTLDKNEDTTTPAYEERNWIDFASSEYAGGNGTRANPFIISTAQELAFFSKNIDEIRNYTVGKFFMLGDNIELNDGYFDENGNYYDGGDGILYVLSLIGSKAGDYRLKNSTLDGNNFTVSGAYAKGTTYAGFIAHCIDATICNLKVTNSYFETANSGAAGICASLGGNSTIYNCVFDGFAKAGLGWCGGIVGISQAGCNVYDCINYGKISATRLCGGILGYQNAKFEISNCINYGDVSGADYSFGGIVGQGNAVNCKNYGTISAGSSVGGIIGTGDILKYCQNYGTINGKASSGGLIGAGYIVYKSENYGNVKGTSNNIGGISGTNYSTKGTFIECVNYGSVYGSTFVGGIVALQHGLILNCVNYGFIDGGNSVGGISGSVKATAIIKDCLNEGNVDARVRHNGIYGEVESGASIANTLSVSSQDKCYVGNDFSGFYIDYKTGKIGIKVLTGKGLYQAKVTEQTLIDRGFKKLST